MAQQSLAKQADLKTVKGLATSQKMMKRFEEILGKRAPMFLSSLITAVNANEKLRKAEPESVLGAAMTAARLDLEIIQSLGFAAIVPYYKNGIVYGQFQIMAKGIVQLALRTGQYKNINVTEVYKDEFKSVDILTGELEFEPVGNGDRANGNAENIVGYVAFFELLNGFRKTVYWPVEKIDKHAKKFSPSYGSSSSPWRTNYSAMCEKTVLKSALSKWGLLSVQMQTAIANDQSIRTSDETSNNEYPENPGAYEETDDGIAPNDYVDEAVDAVEVGHDEATSPEELLGKGGLE
jgi:recombination protein RecT